MESNLENFLWYLSAERRLSKNTEEAYRNDLRAWTEFSDFKLNSQTPPSQEVIVQGLQNFKAQGMGTATVARRKVALRMFARFQSIKTPEWEKVLKALPMNRAEEKFPKALTASEIQKFLEFEPGAEPRLIRNKALIELLYASGLRVSEVISLEWKHVDERMGGVRVMGKGSKERFVPFTEQSAQWLNKYRDQVWGNWAERASKKNKGRIFLSSHAKPLSRMTVWKIVHQRSLEAGIDLIHPHVLRHSFATHLIQGGADVRVVQILLGHTTLDATERYLKIGDQELHRVFREFHPLNR